MVDDGPCLNKNIFLVFFLKRKTQRRKESHHQLSLLLSLCVLFGKYTGP